MLFNLWFVVILSWVCICCVAALGLLTIYTAMQLFN